MKTTFAKEPALVIGTIATLIVLVASQALDSGIVTSQGGVNLLHFLVALVPAAAAALTRLFVSPAN